jgi:hypothetical protein
MKAQELRDKLAAIRQFTVLLNGDPVTDVVIDIANSSVNICSNNSKSVMKEAPDKEADILKKLR